MSDTEVANGLQQLFNHRKQLIILGLTGRTGSGCTTLSKMLTANEFESLNLSQPKVPPQNHEERKYRVVFDWISSNWHPFKRISVSDLITGHIAALGYTQFDSYINQLIKSRDLEQSDIKELSTLKDEFDRISDLAVSTLLWTNVGGKNCPKETLQFVFKELPDFTSSMRALLRAKSPNLDSFFFQTIGDNIRRSGNPYGNDVVPEKLFSIPAVLEKLIQISIEQDATENKPTYLVIDAVRHPFEAKYLQERFSFFYLIAVTAGDQERRRRLSNQQFRSDEIDRLDIKEYPREKKQDMLEGYNLLVSQDIQSSIEAADIHLFNEKDSSSEDSPRELKEMMLRYISLMMHPGLVTPTSIERCMQAAFTAKLNSGCISRQVGAVVSDNGFSVKAIGWNDVPKGQVPCSLRNVRHLLSGEDKEAFSDYEDGIEFKNYIRSQPISAINTTHHNGRNLSYCFKSNYNKLKKEKNQVHTRSLHAEENAFLQLARSSSQVMEGGFLFTTASPCELCAKKAFQLGISRIYYIDPYPGISNNHVLAQGKIASRPQLLPFTGAVGRTYHQLFAPIMAMKDELEFLIPKSLGIKSATKSS